MATASPPASSPAPAVDDAATAAAPPPSADIDLPRAAVRKVVKARLAAFAPAPASDDAPAAKEPGLTKDAVAALAESAKIFVSFITSTANDICRASKRQTLSADDVLTALTDAGFDELAGPLRDSLAAAAAERAAAAGAAKKRKAEEAAVAAAGGEGCKDPDN